MSQNPDRECLTKNGILNFIKGCWKIKHDEYIIDDWDFKLWSSLANLVTRIFVKSGKAVARFECIEEKKGKWNCE